MSLQKSLTEQNDVNVQQNQPQTNQTQPQKPPGLVQKGTVKTSDKGYRLFGTILLVLLLGGSFLWGLYAPMQSAVSAPGKIEVTSKNKVIQHLEGGIIDAVYVSDGDTVVKGQPLIKLSGTQLHAKLMVVESNLWQSLVSVERLTAEASDQDELVWSDEVAALSGNATVNAYKTTQATLFKLRRKAFHSEQSIVAQQIEQTHVMAKGIQEVIESQQQRIESLKADIADWKKLYETQLTDKVRLREMERQLVSLMGEVSQNKSELLRLEQSRLEFEFHLALKKQEYLKMVNDQLRQYEKVLVEARSEKIALEEKIERLTIKATDTGRVVGLNVASVDEVINPGSSIMQIVPMEDKFEILGQLQTTDIDQVAMGQKVEIQFSAFHTNFLPVTYGHISNISADVLFDQVQGSSYYKIEVKISDEAIAVLAKQGWTLTPGMPVDLLIQTRKTTLVNYLIKPFVVMWKRAFNEDNGL